MAKPKLSNHLEQHPSLDRRQLLASEQRLRSLVLCRVRGVPMRPRLPSCRHCHQRPLKIRTSALPRLAASWKSSGVTNYAGKRHCPSSRLPGNCAG